MHLARGRYVPEMLGIPSTVTQAALLPVADTIGADFRPAVRRPAATITFWDEWGAKPMRYTVPVHIDVPAKK